MTSSTWNTASAETRFEGELRAGSFGSATVCHIHPPMLYWHRQAPVAQRIEQWFPKPCVAGSSPARGTCPERGSFFVRDGWSMVQSAPESRPARQQSAAQPGLDHQEEDRSMSRQPKRDLRRRQQRQRKVRALRERLENTTSPEKREQLIAKIKKLSPTAPVPSK